MCHKVHEGLIVTCDQRQQTRTYQQYNVLIHWYRRQSTLHILVMIAYKKCKPFIFMVNWAIVIFTIMM